MDNNERFCLLRNQDCHWYLVPLELYDEFCELDDECGGRQYTRWAKFDDMRINGDPSSISFTNPKKI